MEKYKQILAGFISSFFKKREVHILLAILLLLSIPSAVSLAQQRWEPGESAARGKPPTFTTATSTAPAGVPASALGYPATDGNIYWRGDYETGDTGQWGDGITHTGRYWENSSIQVVTSPVHWGKYAGKFTVIPNGYDGARAEISSNRAQTGGYSDQAWYYSWSIYVPSIPNQASGWGYWANVTQWMDLYAKCSPPIWLALHSGPPLSYSLQSDIDDNQNGCKHIGPNPSHEWNIGTFKYDVWNDFTLHVKWSEDPTVGFVQMWRNGKEVVPFTHMRTLDTSGGVYMEQDLYHPGGNGPNVIYIDGTRRHDAYK